MSFLSSFLHLGERIDSVNFRCAVYPFCSPPRSWTGESHRRFRARFPRGYSYRSEGEYIRPSLTASPPTPHLHTLQHAVNYLVHSPPACLPFENPTFFFLDFLLLWDTRDISNLQPRRRPCLSHRTSSSLDSYEPESLGLQKSKLWHWRRVDHIYVELVPCLGLADVRPVILRLYKYIYTPHGHWLSSPVTTELRSAHGALLVMSDLDATDVHTSWDCTGPRQKRHGPRVCR